MCEYGETIIQIQECIQNGKDDDDDNKKEEI